MEKVKLINLVKNKDTFNKFLILKNFLDMPYMLSFRI